MRTSWLLDRTAAAPIRSATPASDGAGRNRRQPTTYQSCRWCPRTMHQPGHPIREEVGAAPGRPRRQRCEKSKNDQKSLSHSAARECNGRTDGSLDRLVGSPKVLRPSACELDVVGRARSGAVPSWDRPAARPGVTPASFSASAQTGPTAATMMSALRAVASCIAQPHLAPPR